jgi:MFS family permease
MSASERVGASARLSDSVVGIAIIAITGMQLMSTLDGTIVIVALPRMQADLDLSDAAKSWVITAYVLTFGGLLVAGSVMPSAANARSYPVSGCSPSPRWSAGWPPTSGR